MLHPHSLLWHYLWLGPHVLEAALAALLWRRGIHKLYPVFFTYLVFEVIEEIALYFMDVVPLGSARAWWIARGVGSLIAGAIKLGVVGELFFHLLRPRPTLAKCGRYLITGSGAVLVLLATAAAAFAQKDHPQYIWISRTYILLQSLYIVDGGLVLFLFVFAAYHKLAWNRSDFGVALGFGIVFFQHMAGVAIMASGALANHLYLIDFLSMTTYHACVVMWFYYLLVPQKATTSAVLPHETSLDNWNRELERLLQR